jgi:hypothetical protein
LQFAAIKGGNQRSLKVKRSVKENIGKKKSSVRKKWTRNENGIFRVTMGDKKTRKSED